MHPINKNTMMWIAPSWMDSSNHKLRMKNDQEHRAIPKETPMAVIVRVSRILHNNLNEIPNPKTEADAMRADERRKGRSIIDIESSRRY